jgi:hypothetical protein
LENAIVCSAEFGTSIITKEKPFEYLHLFGHVQRLARHIISEGCTTKLARREVSKWTGLETVTYTSRTGSHGFIGYDKTKEMKNDKQKIPPLYDGKNVLRLEYKIRSRRGIQAKFKNDLSAYDLFSETVYRRFQRLFLNKYKSIYKMGQSVYFIKPAKMTPAKLVKLLAEIYRQNHAKEYQRHLQHLIEERNLTKKNLELIRAKNNKMGNDIYLVDQNALIKELDALVNESCSELKNTFQDKRNSKKHLKIGQKRLLKDNYFRNH